MHFLEVYAVTIILIVVAGLRHCITSVAGKATVAPPFRRLRSLSLTPQSFDLQGASLMPLAFSAKLIFLLFQKKVGSFVCYARSRSQDVCMISCCFYFPPRVKILPRYEEKLS